MKNQNAIIQIKTNNDAALLSRLKRVFTIPDDEYSFELYGEIKSDICGTHASIQIFAWKKIDGETFELDDETEHQYHRYFSFSLDGDGEIASISCQKPLSSERQSVREIVETWLQDEFGKDYEYA